MKNITRHTGTLEVLRPLPSSQYGNPRYVVRVDGFECVTQVDHKHGYSVNNDHGATVDAAIGTHYGQATLNGYRVLARA